MIDRATIQRVMDATDIVDVVKEFVTLRKSGANYKGLCPFHNERTPSFSVSPAKQLCKCFSCGKRRQCCSLLDGTGADDLSRGNKMVRAQIWYRSQRERVDRYRATEQSERESMFALNEWANNYFQNILHDNVDGVAIGMAYFRSRGFRDDIIRKFNLGYSLEQRDAFC